MVSSDRLRILVLDDDIPFLESFKELLTLDGHYVYPVTRGFEAVEMARLVPLDLSFLDYDLPDLDGIETFARIRRQRPELPAVFISGNPSESLERMVREVGGFALIRKPLDAGRLRVVIRQVTFKKYNPFDGLKGDMRWRN